MKSLLTIVFLLAVCLSSYGQMIVKGKVTSAEDGQELPGVSIRIKGTSSGAITDIDGRYVVEVTNAEAVLIYSFIGHTTQVLAVDGRTTIDIMLEIEVSQLSEVVVVGYGTQKKQKITSAVSVLDTEELKKMPVATVSNALEGLASGLFVRQGSGEPGFSSSSFEVRNFGNALVIVDGSPGSIDELGPNEIESITVLKDAAAAAVYGVQGGNGVVVVTTRRGSKGKPVLTYGNQFTLTSFTAYPEFLNSQQYATVLNEGLNNAGRAPFYSDEQIDLYSNGSDPLNYPNENWRDLMFKEYGFQQRHNLNVDGGNDKARYFVSASFLDQGSNYESDVLNYQQFNLRSNIDADITDNLHLSLSVAGRRRVNEAPAYSAFNVFRELSRALPTNLAYYPDGTPARPQFSPNHVIEGVNDNNAGYYEARNNNIDTKLSLKWELPVQGLSVQSYASMIFNNNFRKEWNKSYELFSLNRSSGDYQKYIATPEGTFSETVLTLNNSYDNHYVLQESVNYENIFGNHSISGLLLGELQYRNGENFFGRRQDFQSTFIDQLFAGSNENKDANGGEFVETRLGLVGRVSYDFKAKYFIESSFRYDGSSRFAPGKQWGFFPSVSVGWRISEESFFSELTNYVPSLKIRASVGTAGSDGTAAYQWLSGFAYNFFYGINETAIPTIDNSVLPNLDLTWETLTTYDVGVDASFLQNDLSLSVDYFYRDRIGVLAGASGSVPSTLGVGLAAQNLHQYSNQGFEVTTSYSKKVNRDLRVNATLNFSYSRETAEFIDEALLEDPFMRQNLTITGGFTGLRRGYVSDGLFQSEEEIASHAIQDNGGNNSLQPGDVKYVDLNEDGVIDVLDQKVFGNGDKATSNYSLNLGAVYKQFSLSILMTGAAGYDIYLDGEAQSPLRNGFNGYTYQLDYWTPENTDAAYPRVSDGGFNDNNYRYSDFWIRDGQHLRVKNITLSYTVPKSVAALKKFQDVRIFFTGYNLFMLKAFEEDFDPQMSSGTGWYYPQNKSFTLGLNFSI
ncbi:MAG: TonB-linked SusC/RagA family outer membrane protein [Marivirga sp.]|jgi:TonB-linked SusC/RagA family outer membrane protein